MTDDLDRKLRDGMFPGSAASTPNVIRETLAKLPAGGFTRLLTMLTPSLAPTDEMLYLGSHICDVATEVIALDGGLLAVRQEDIHVSFVVFRRECGESYVTDQYEPRTPAYYSVLFHGDGPSGSLRELRHTTWGESGYIYYPNGLLISDAFKHLARWFDCD